MSLLRRALGGAERRGMPFLTNYGDGYYGDPTYYGDGAIPPNSWIPTTSSGAAVTEQTSLQLSIFYACVRLLADSIAALPWEVYRTTGETRTKVIDPEPQIVRQPFPEVSTFDWKHMLVVSMAMRGNAYGYVAERDRLGYPTSILPLHPDWVVLNRDPKTGEKICWVNGQREPIQDLFHIKWFTLPGFDIALSPLQIFRQSIGMGLAAEEFGGKWFRDGAAPSSTLETEQILTDDQIKQTQRQWVTSQGGKRLPAVLSGGFKWKPVTITPEESQFLECVVPGTPVTMADGRRKPVEDLATGDRVMSWDGEKLTWSRVAHVGTPPMKPLVRIRTARGRELTATADHPVLARRAMRTPGCRPITGAEWIHMGDLAEGNYVRVALGDIQDAPSGSLTADEAYLLGILVGDGYLSKGGLSFASVEPETVARVDSILRSLGGGLKHRDGPDYTIFTGGVGRGGSRIRDLLKASGQVGRHSHDKTVPEIVEAAGPEAWAAFLSGYFDADGSVRPQGGKQTPAAYFSSTSLELIKGCQHLLASLGIQSAIYSMSSGGRKVVNGQECDTRPSWGLYVMGVSPLRALACELKLSHPEKRARLAAHLDSAPSRYREDNFLFDRIVEVEHLDMGETVGVEIEGTHTFVTAGIVTHNTQKFQVAQIARVFGIPPHMVGDVDRSTSWGTGIEQMSVGFVTYTLGPWIARIESAFNGILPRGQELKFNVEGLLRGDIAARYSAYQMGLDSGFLNPDEVRAKEDLEPIPGGKGKLFRQPLNFGPLGYDPTQHPAPNPSGTNLPVNPSSKQPSGKSKTPTSTPASTKTPTPTSTPGAKKSSS